MGRGGREVKLAGECKEEGMVGGRSSGGGWGVKSDFKGSHIVIWGVRGSG